jgi:thymidylate kinase
VVAVEGWCFAGKTTLARALARQGAAVTVLAEYADLAALPPFPPRGPADVTAALEHFLALERDRAATAREAQAPLLVCDRSPLTLIVYEFGAAALGLPADPHGAADLFADAAESDHILIPDAYIHLQVPPDVAHARQQKRGPVRPHLMHPVLRDTVNAAYTRYLAQVPPARRLQLDGARPHRTLTARARGFLADLPRALTVTARPPSWRCLHTTEGITTGRGNSS